MLAARARWLWLPLLLLGAALASCGGPPPPPLRVGTILWPGHEPLFLARQLGYLDAGRVRLVEYSTITEAERAFRNGNVDAVALTLDSALALEAQGFAPRVALVLDASTGADALLAVPPLSSVRALKGRRVGVEPSGPSLYLLARALTHAGLAAGDVQRVTVPVDEHAQALSAGRVDAVATFEPYVWKLESAGAVRLFDSRDIPGEILDVLLVSEPVAGARAADLTHLREAWFAALAHLERWPEDALPRMGERLGATEFEVRAVLRGLHFTGEAENRALLGGGAGAELLAPAREVARAMAQMGLLRRPVDPAALLPEEGVR